MKTMTINATQPLMNALYRAIEMLESSNEDCDCGKRELRKRLDDGEPCWQCATESKCANQLKGLLLKMEEQSGRKAVDLYA